MIDSLKNMFVEHQQWRSECVNLVASENVMSPMARMAIQSDMGQRYYFENPYVQESGVCYSYRGTRYISDVLRVGQELAQQIFGIEYASLYPISGHQEDIRIGDREKNRCLDQIGTCAAIAQDGQGREGHEVPGRSGRAAE